MKNWLISFTNLRTKSTSKINELELLKMMWFLDEVWLCWEPPEELVVTEDLPHILYCPSSIKWILGVIIHEFEVQMKVRWWTYILLDVLVVELDCSEILC